MAIGHNIYECFPLQNSPKFTQIIIFGLKIYHLATLFGKPFCQIFAFYHFLRIALEATGRMFLVFVF
jgi:hypothetical protein